MLFTSPAVPLIPIIEQIPLIQVVNEDDQILLNSPDAEWFRILNNFPWQEHRDVAAAYCDALYDFNSSGASAEEDSPDSSAESEDDARLRLLSGRATVNKDVPVLYEPEFRTPAVRTVNPLSVAPGVIPFRSDGRKPKCFFALFKAFIGASLMGFPPEPDKVHLLLTSNLSFARVCGFVPKGTDEKYWQSHVPGLRKLEQFDQIMTEYGLWDREKWDEVRRNIRDGVFREESEVVGDTTHYQAYSGFETVKYKDENGKDLKKSQSLLTKNCGCEDRETCPHPLELADDGAGTVVKSRYKIIWAHKAAIIGLPGQEIPLDAAAVSDAASNDGRTFLPHLERLFDNLPETRPWFDIALYDAACCDQGLKEDFMENHGILLRTSLNPRKIATLTGGLPRCMESLTPCGTLTCAGGHDMDYRGVRNETRTFIYQASSDGEDGAPVCLSCPHRAECCPDSEGGRTATVSFDLLPHIDPQDPRMAKRFKATMARRTSVGRMIKRLKCDLGDSRLTKRGNASFQAYLDKTMIALHILLRG